MTVGSAPGTHHLRCGDFLTQHFGNRSQQAAADDRVVFRENLQGHVLVDDLGHQIAQLIQLVDVPCIHQHAVGQRPRLVAAGLVRLVEQWSHLRVLREHHAIEVGDKGFAAAFEQRNSGFDDGTVLRTKHKGVLLNDCFSNELPFGYQFSCQQLKPYKSIA
ncbi:hypothetical protein D3C78_766410 [compost metagenome]